LGLIYTCDEKYMKKYLIEVGVNLAHRGDKGHSCEGHYQRQVDSYSKNDIAQSIVIMVYTNRHKPSKYFWPKEENPKVLYITVEHFLDEDKNSVKVLLSADEHFVIKID